MLKPKSDFLNILAERGYIHQCSDLEGLDRLAARGEVIAYVGYDCTAPSLHVGHLLPTMMLHWLQQTGGKPIALMGGGTTRVGDPSGRDETRRILPLEQIDTNKESIKRVFAKLLTFGDDRTGAIMIDKAEWLAPLNYIEFLRDVGRHFSVNRMLTMDSARLRLEREQELSFIEFNYMLLQAYDFVELAKRYRCNLQMGGSDQWGNIVTGIDLGRRMGTHQLYALTCPLLTTASGAKIEAAAETARKTFEQGTLAEGLPTYTVKIGAGVGMLKLFVDAGLASSNTEVRKAVANNAISINDVKISDPAYVVTDRDFVGGVSKLSFGKKKHVLVRKA
jgi:tyrosyl-tRNA synthetase